MTREEWLQERKNGIGGSDASSIVDRNPYMDKIKLWQIKTGKIEQEDISEKECVKYGVNLEPALREIFQAKHPQYEVKHEENKIIKHPQYEFLFASLDGTLIDKETRRNAEYLKLKQQQY